MQTSDCIVMRLLEKGSTWLAGARPLSGKIGVYTIRNDSLLCYARSMKDCKAPLFTSGIYFDDPFNETLICETLVFVVFSASLKALRLGLDLIPSLSFQTRILQKYTSFSCFSKIPNGNAMLP